MIKDTELLIIQKNGLRTMAKTLNALSLQVIQLTNQVRELRLKIAEKEVNNG